MPEFCILLVVAIVLLVGLIAYVASQAGEELLSSREAANLLGITHPEIISTWFESGLLPSSQKIDGVWYISKKEVLSMQHRLQSESDE